MARFFNRPKASRLPKPAYCQLAGRAKFDPMKEAEAIAIQSWEWSKKIYCFDLIASIPLPGWIPSPNALAAHVVRLPADLARLNWAHVSGLAADFPAVQPVLLLRHAACICSTCSMPNTGGAQALASPGQIASSFRRTRIDDTPVAPTGSFDEGVILTIWLGLARACGKNPQSGRAVMPIECDYYVPEYRRASESPPTCTGIAVFGGAGRPSIRVVLRPGGLPVLPTFR